MNTILIIIIVITAATTYFGLQQPLLFEKYKFNVSSILYKKEYIRVFSAGFLHADWGHFFFNMLTLYFFSPTILATYGVSGFLIIYVGSILLGNLFSLYLYQKQGWYSAIGASGGVSGILFAAIAVFPTMKINFIIPGYLFGFGYFAYSVYSMLKPRNNDNTGHAAHLGGAFFGVVYAIALEPELAFNNAFYIGVMALPLVYMGYEVFIKKKIG